MKLCSDAELANHLPSGLSVPHHIRPGNVTRKLIIIGELEGCDSVNSHFRVIVQTMVEELYTVFRAVALSKSLRSIQNPVRKNISYDIRFNVHNVGMKFEFEVYWQYAVGHYSFWLNTVVMSGLGALIQAISHTQHLGLTNG